MIRRADRLFRKDKMATILVVYLFNYLNITVISMVVNRSDMLPAALVCLYIITKKMLYANDTSIVSIANTFCNAESVLTYISAKYYFGIILVYQFNK